MLNFDFRESPVDRAEAAADLFNTLLIRARPRVYIEALITELLHRKEFLETVKKRTSAITRAIHDLIQQAKAQRKHPVQWLLPSLLSHHPKPEPQNKISRPAVETTTQSSSLLRLPFEIRTMILQYTFDECHFQHFQSPKGPSAYGLLVPEFVSPPLARTCVQLRHEVLPLFYVEHTFVLNIDSLKAFNTAKTWLNSIGDYDLNLIQSLVLVGHKSPPNGTPSKIVLKGMDMRQVWLGLNLQSMDANAFYSNHPESTAVGQFMSLVAMEVHSRAAKGMSKVESVCAILDSFARRCADVEELRKTIL